MSERTKEESAAGKLFTRPLLAGALAAAALPAMDAAAEIFLKITTPTIDGESQNAKHFKSINVVSFGAGFNTAVS